MTIPQVPLDTTSESRAWLQLRTTPEGAHLVRILLQNELARRIAAAHSKLETAEDIKAVIEEQASIRAARSLYAFIASHDTVPTKT